MFQALRNVLPNKLARKLIALGAKLDGVNGFTGRGEVKYTLNKNGETTLEITLRSVAGRQAFVYANEERVARVNVKKGRADVVLASKKGATLPTLAEGASVQVRQNGDAILSGVLSRS